VFEVNDYKTDLLHRWEENPVLTLEDMPFRANTVFNGTPIRLPEGGIGLILRIEGQQGYSFFALARSHDGLHFKVDEHPVMIPAEGGIFAQYESRGIEDPRATWLDDAWYVMYTAYSEWGPVIALARTDDGVHYERLGIVSGPGNKDGVLFPKKIGGRYARLDRPIGHDVGSIWISYSEDLLHWGDSEVVIVPRPGFWDAYRIGASVPPIELENGWLEIYHGVRMTSAGPIYRMGTVVLDKENPAKVLCRSCQPILSPRTDYERIGDVPNVCFACGAVIDGDDVKIYYGAADTSICAAFCTMQELIDHCFPCKYPMVGKIDG